MNLLVSCNPISGLGHFVQLNGTTERPRLAVFRSNQHLYAQVIDDTKQHTLAAASTLSKEIREAIEDTAGPTIVSLFTVTSAFGLVVRFRHHLSMVLDLSCITFD